MILFKRPAQLQQYLDLKRKRRQKLGFVPTMGALHAGHISLIKLAKEDQKLAVCSIFVNPTQFNDASDYQKYPITIEKDIALLEAAGADILFLPDVTDMYPQSVIAPHYDLGYLGTILEGKHRPGHFDGVCTIVQRFLEIVMPDQLYLGQKDYQQCMVLKKMTELSGLNAKVEIVISPTLREKDGLAMSSRNARLSMEQRLKAITIYKSLNFIKDNLKQGELAAIKHQVLENLQQQGFRPDYVEIADAGNLNLVERWDGKQKLVALIAAFLGDVRLIDNMLIN